MTEKTKVDPIIEKRNEWFEQLIHFVQTDKDFLNMGIASDDTKSFWDKHIFGPRGVIFSDMRETSTQYFIAKLILDYVKELSELKVNPLKLYMDHNDSQVLVWAEITDEDEKTEMDLYKAEAKANAKNYQHGFHISSTILEKCDKVSPPPHYQKFLK